VAQKNRTGFCASTPAIDKQRHSFKFQVLRKEQHASYKEFEQFAREKKRFAQGKRSDLK
jgi:hypothetical protein